MSDLIKVHDPKNPGDFLLVNDGQLKEGKYKLFSEPLRAPKKAVAETLKKPAIRRAANKPKQSRKP